MQIEFIRVKEEESEMQKLSALATEIVREHFDPLIGKPQNDYMLAKFQTEEAIRQQMEDGYRYYWVVADGKIAGFLAFYPRKGKMYLSKFYVQKSFRGRHLAAKMHDFVCQETMRKGLSAIELNVNRGNLQVIDIYEHLGYHRIREEKNDIGGGFFMDDYVLECRL